MLSGKGSKGLSELISCSASWLTLLAPAKKKKNHFVGFAGRFLLLFQRSLSILAVYAETNSLECH